VANVSAWSQPSSRDTIRFANHKSGIKAAFVVKHYSLRLMPELYAHLNPTPYAAAAQMEMDLAEDLRRAD